jgi:hypothetical protein
MDQLAVGEDDDDEQHHDGERHPGGQEEIRQPGQGQNDQDLLGCVGDRRERVARKDWQRHTLGQQGVVDTAAGELAAEQ